jgi:hypothetical protein
MVPLMLWTSAWVKTLQHIKRWARGTRPTCNNLLTMAPLRRIGRTCRWGLLVRRRNYLQEQQRLKKRFSLQAQLFRLQRQGA